jgi:hypothetical protein
LLRSIRRAAEREFKLVFPEVVLSVPAYFDAIHVGALKDAAGRAGFDHVDTIPEPVAAALAFNITVTPRPLNFLVFDLGAGTLDVTAAEVWRTKPGPGGLNCRCLKDTGDTHLGGLDMDDRLVEYLIGAMQLDGLGDEDRLRLRRAIEGAKIRLSTETTATVQFEVGSKHAIYELSRIEFEGALKGASGADDRNLIEACRQQVLLALNGAGWTAERVEHLLLIGGPTAMPCIRRMLEEIFHRNPTVLAQIRQPGTTMTEGVDPMLAVAKGAAQSHGTQLTKIHPYGYGFIDVRLEPVADQPVNRVHRVPRILVARDSVFPSEPVTVTPDNPYYRLDHIFSIEIIQHVPSSEIGTPSVSKQEFRFLGEHQLGFARIPYLMQVSMRLNENGELETTLRNLLGAELATYVGVGSLSRHPIELPTSKIEAQTSSGHTPLRFVPENAETVKRCASGILSFMHAKTRARPSADPYLLESMERLQAIIGCWGSSLKDEVNQVFNTAQEVLSRALELKVIEPNEHNRHNDELVAARCTCYHQEKT